MLVAGVVVQPDQEFKVLESELQEIVRRYIPAEDQEGFVFHATHLFGGGKYWDRERWPKDLRWEILDKLTSLFAKYDLPVAYGYVDKQRYVDKVAEVLGEQQPLKASLQMAHAAAFSTAAMGVQRLLDRYAKEKDSVAMFVAEDHPEMRGFLKRVQYLFKDPEQEVFKIPDGEGLRVPLTRVVDTLHFAEKQENSLLQLADVAAFCLKRYIMKRPHADRFIKPILPQTFFMMREEKLKEVVEGFLADQAAKQELDKSQT